MRTVEQEVKDIEAQIRAEFPEALYIELEPHSRKVRSYAIDDGMEASSKRSEIESINLIQKNLLLFAARELENTKNVITAKTPIISSVIDSSAGRRSSTSATRHTKS